MDEAIRRDYILPSVQNFIIVKPVKREYDNEVGYEN